MNWQTPAEAAADVRAAFKARGWNSRMVSVRAEQFSMGSAINVTIKHASIPVHVAKEIAEGKERISRCQITGEILSGGNRYVSVSVSDQAAKDKAAPYLQAVEAAIASLNPDKHSRGHAEIVDCYTVAWGMHGFGFALWGESSHLKECSNAHEVAYYLATAIETGRR